MSPGFSDSSSPRPRRARAGLAAAIALLVLLAYANSFSGPFVFDDVPAVRDNATLAAWSRRVFSPPEGTTVAGRPVLNVSLALSRSPDGGTARHHALNLAIHLAAALVLFGLLRRTAERLRAGPDASLLAAAVAVLWAVQPVQTEAVTYIVQRAESLMALWYLLTLYCFLRGATAARGGGGWFFAAVSACALGMGTKEVMVSAPLVVLLYDRALLAGSLRAALRQRGRFYASLAATWLVLGFLVWRSGGNRGGSIGFGVGVGWWEHALTQPGALAHYLRLAVWPQPLVFEYEPVWVQHAADALWPAVPVLLLLVLTGRALRRNDPAGVAGALGFAVLAPTSLLPAPTQLIVEHRVYLPLAALLAVGVPALWRALGRRAAWALGAIAVGFVALTARRNADYRSELALWSDTVAKRPANALAQGSLANALSRAGQPEAALAHAAAAVRLEPQRAYHHYDLGVVLAKLGRRDEALAAYARAVELDPAYADARNNYAVALAQAGRAAEAEREFEALLRLRPRDAEARANFGALLADTGRLEAAGEQFAAALRERPDFAAACLRWGTVLVRQGRFTEAQARYEEAVRLRPDDPAPRNKLGLLLLALGRAGEAVATLEAAAQLAPADPETRANLALARSRLGRAAPP